MTETIPPNRSAFWVIAGAAVMVMILIVLMLFMIQRHLTLREAVPVDLTLSQADQRALLQNPERLHAGKMQYKLRCAECHSYDGSGSKSAPDLTDNEWIYDGTLNGIILTIAQGSPMRGMPGWEGKLLPKDIQALGAYVKTLSE